MVARIVSDDDGSIQGRCAFGNVVRKKTSILITSLGVLLMDSGDTVATAQDASITPRAEEGSR
jgi:hypothetical protein